MRPLLQKKANGETIDENMIELFAGPQVKANVDSYYTVSGRYNQEQSFLTLLLENSGSIGKLLKEGTPIASVCSVQSKNKLKNVTGLALIKKK